MSSPLAGLATGPPVGGCATETSTGTCDYSGEESSGTLISHAEDSFLTGGGDTVSGINNDCTGGTGEEDDTYGDCAYSIQLNSNRWLISGICGTGMNACYGWEQFVYTSIYGESTAYVDVEDEVIDYGNYYGSGNCGNLGTDWTSVGNGNCGTYEYKLNVTPATVIPPANSPSDFSLSLHRRRCGGFEPR